MRVAALVAGWLAVLVAVLVVGVAVVGSLTPRGPAPRGDVLAPADVGRDTPLISPPALAADTDVVAWAAGRAARTGVPAQALAAYATAEIAQREATPRCHLSWATLAGIGRVESFHGGLGAELDAGGVARPPIIGVPLDGTNGTRRVADTDGGRLDGDPVLDRAVGPMQFLPATWARYGEGDPQSIDDAGRAAARYLCAGGRDLATGPGWWSGVLAYNASGDYARRVYAAATRYTTAQVG